MPALTELLMSVAALLWPLLVFWTLFTFRTEIAAAMARISSAKILGNEIELDTQLEKLGEAVDQASNEVEALPRDLSPALQKSSSNATATEPQDAIAKIHEAASQSPKIALLMLETEMEREAKKILASIGKLSEQKTLSFVRLIDRLDSHYGLPRYVLSSLRLFASIRNKIVHSKTASEEDVITAIDSGVMIYRALQSLPHERNWVHHVDVPLYSDDKCLLEIPEVKGIILKTESSGGTTTSYRIFPSTRSHFRIGKQVSWDWDFTRTWDEVWYKDPDSNLISQAWSSSGEFIGRHLDDL